MLLAYNYSKIVLERREKANDEKASGVAGKYPSVEEEEGGGRDRKKMLDRRPSV